MTADLLASPLLLVGPGRAGKALARSWRRAGGRIAAVVARDADGASRAGEELDAPGLVLREAPPRAAVVAVAVPDDRIGAVARELAARTRTDFAFHLSGALPAAVLAPLAASGAMLASLHPLRAFPGSPDEDWRGALVAVEGEPAAVEAGERLAKALGATPYRIAPSAKPLYHAAAALAAGGTMALLAAAVRAAVSAGIPEADARAALGDLAAGAAAATARLPFDQAMTGPVARRDAATVAAHVAALRELPDVLAYYRSLAREILRVTPGRGREEELAILLDEAETPPAAPSKKAAPR